VGQTPLVKIRARTAAEVCVNFHLDSNAKKLLRDGINPEEFVTALIDKRNLVAAIDFLAHALPPREGIWWASLCTEHALGENWTARDKAAATAAVMWVMQPAEENRDAARAPAAACDPMSPAGSAALAVSQTASEPPFAWAKAIARAVVLASIKVPPANIGKMQKCYVDLGLEIAEGKLIST
jgi:hypothetical protein